MATLEQQLADAIAAQNALTQAVANYKQQLDQSVASQKAAYDAWKSGIKSSMPVTPNLLVDTKRFTKMCGGQVNTAVDLLAAHGGPWGAFLWNGSEGSGTIKIVTLDKLEAEGIGASGELLRACPPSFYGSDFRVALFDVTISKPYNGGGEGHFYVLNQGCSTFTGWGYGEFLTQASCFINVLECTGSMGFAPHSNMPADVACGAGEKGKGWLFRRGVKTGWGGCHQPRFWGIGRMKVAIALPYIGFGDHGDKYVWAGSVGRYSHEDQITY